MSSLVSRLDTTIARMPIHLPFIAAVAMSMRAVVEKCGTACTNGAWVKFDPTFCATLTDPELAYLYAHEAMHKALLHAWRRGMRIPALWNVACDHVINLSLNNIGSGSIKMPNQGYADRRFTGMSEEQIYDILLAEGFRVPASYVMDIVEDGGRSGADAEIEVINIAKACQMAGIQDGLIDIVLGNAQRAVVRWQDVLRSFVSSNVRSGSTWARPSRRSDAAGIYLPSLRSKVLGSIVLFGDFSGSMMSLVEKILNEMQGVVDEVSPEYTHVICGDTRVTFFETFDRGAQIRIRSSGGGGTDFRPLFEEVDKRGLEPDCGVFLTDTYGTFPKVPPKYPLIWGLLGTHGDVHVPWGETVRVAE